MKYVKRWIGCLCMVFALAMILPAVLPADTFAVRVEAASVKLSASKATLAVGQKYSLSVKGTKAKVTWSSGNTKVATETRNRG